jgi:hypothetical protein
MPKKDESMEVTAPRAWVSKRRGELVELPSGNVARLRKVEIFEIVATGSIPDSLSALISEVIAATEKGTTPDDQKLQEEFAQTVTVEELAQMVARVVPLVFAEPRLVAEPRQPDYDAGELALEDVDWDDRLFAFNWAMGEVGIVADFFGTEGVSTPSTS